MHQRTSVLKHGAKGCIPVKRALNTIVGVETMHQRTAVFKHGAKGCLLVKRTLNTIVGVCFQTTGDTSDFFTCFGCSLVVISEGVFVIWLRVCSKRVRVTHPGAWLLVRSLNTGDLLLWLWSQCFKSEIHVSRNCIICCRL